MSKMYTTLNNMGFLRPAYPMPDPECYIYLHHVGVKIILPSYGEANSDGIAVRFTSSTPLLRSAPIQSYNNSGPRTLLLALNLHRDMIDELNYLNVSGAELIAAAKDSTGYTDYVDLMAKLIQAAALPTYEVGAKMVNPPLVSLKLGNEIFIKGVVSGNVGVSYGLPILENNKYSQVKIDFGITEVMPYDAYTVMKYGSYRGISKDLARGSEYTIGSDNRTAADLGNVVAQPWATNDYTGMNVGGTERSLIL